MNAYDVQWSAGEASIRSRIAQVLSAGLPAATLLHESARRSIHRIELECTTDTALRPDRLVIKIHRISTGRHRLRETAKRWLRRSPGRREWMAFESLFEAGASVPRPRAWGRLGNGDEVIVTDFIDGEPITNGGTEIVDAMAASIGKFHDAGYRHGDLHLGNLLLLDGKVVLLDLQRTRPQRSAHDRLWDLARLELSLASAGWTPTERGTLRDRLDVGDRFDPILRRFLKDHLRGRARRVLRVGRNWSTAQVGTLRGLRDASLEDETLRTLIETGSPKADTQVRRGGRVQLTEAKITDSQGDERTVLVKRIAADGFRRALGDRIRGTPASRAFRAGQESGLLSNRAARPLAFLEERRFGLPVNSLLILEKVGDEDLDCVRPSTPEADNRLGCALGEWLAEGHAWGLSHRDFKASNIRVAIRTEAIQFWMIDLEDLGGPADQLDDARLHALSQLNASIEDKAMRIEVRLATLETYERRLPFALSREIVATEIARRSLVRAHRWRGDELKCTAR